MHFQMGLFKMLSPVSLHHTLLLGNCIFCILCSTQTLVQGRQVRLLAHPHVFSTLKVQRATGTLNETLQLGAVHPRMEMQLPVLVYGALLPQVHPFEVTALVY